jgi:hypothetical protein
MPIVAREPGNERGPEVTAQPTVLAAWQQQRLEREQRQRALSDDHLDRLMSVVQPLFKPTIAPDGRILVVREELTDKERSDLAWAVADTVAATHDYMVNALHYEPNDTRRLMRRFVFRYLMGQTWKPHH